MELSPYLSKKETFIKYLIYFLKIYEDVTQNKGLD